MSYLENVISGKLRGVVPAMLKAILLPISRAVLGAVKLRRRLYSRGVLPRKRLSCKVISVGNIVVGGSGKTPAVISVARMFRESANLSVAILSRGYRSEAQSPAIVSDGENVLLGPSDAGDEPYMMARSLPGVPVLIGKDRFQTGSIAIREWACQVVILDDGFQYLRLARDFDIITMDAALPFGFDHVLPRGYLREPISALRHADLILLTRVDQCEDLGSVRDRLGRLAPSVPIFESVYEPRFLRSLDTHREMGLDAIRGERILAVCGIGNPTSFLKTLRSLCPAEVVLLPFPDHHKYPPRSIEAIRQKASESGVDIIVTTEKDAPKLVSIRDFTVLMLTVELKLVGSTAERFPEVVNEQNGLFAAHL